MTLTNLDRVTIVDGLIPMIPPPFVAGYNLGRNNIDLSEEKLIAAWTPFTGIGMQQFLQGVSMGQRAAVALTRLAVAA